MSAEGSVDEVREGIHQLVGKPFGDHGSVEAPDPVNVPMIRHWVDAIDDQNPIYLDDQAAQEAGHAGLVAPPAMLQTWGMQRPKIAGIAARGGTATEVRGTNPITTLADAGFTGTLATNSDLEFDRYLRPGDLLTSQGILESISEQKTTGLGRGYFVTWVTEYTNQRGESVGRQRFRVDKFAPGTAGEGGDRKKSKRDLPPEPTGEKLPPFDLEVTSTVIVAGAIASRDFMPVHHDPEYARAQGAPDMFMNILTTNGYVARYVTDWAGPRARLEKISIRLGAPCVPGQVMRFSGQVAREVETDRGRAVSVVLAATNDFGAHATGSVEFVL